MSKCPSCGKPPFECTCGIEELKKAKNAIEDLIRLKVREHINRVKIKRLPESIDPQKCNPHNWVDLSGSFIKVCGRCDMMVGEALDD